MKKTLITSIVMVVLVLGVVVVSSIYTDLRFDIGVLVDTTAYRDINDNKDIPNTEDQYMYKTVVEGIPIIIPCKDKYTVVRVSKTQEYIEVYRLRDIIVYMIFVAVVIYMIRFLIQLKNKSKNKLK
jgi:hypothetical protein